MNYTLSPAEHARAEVHRIFSESPEAADLLRQLNNGLITPVEYVHKLLDEWAKFIRQVYII